MNSSAPIRSGVAVTAALLVGACGGTSGGFPGAGPGGAEAPPPVARPATPPVPMAGRWVLASPGRGQCNVTLGAAARGVPEGTVAPEGGCPGHFFTSRKWSYDSNGLLISNHNSEPLVRLSSAGGPRFVGKTSAGEEITLSR